MPLSVNQKLSRLFGSSERIVMKYTKDSEGWKNNTYYVELKSSGRLI